MSCLKLSVLTPVVLFVLSLSAKADGLQRKVIGTHVQEGIEVELALEPVVHGSELNLSVGETVRFLFSIRDTVSGKPVTGLFPAAWVHNRPANVDHKPNSQKMVETFIGGGLFAQPDIDLNVYHVLTLNDDQTISVVDPLFGFGGSKLLTKIALPGNGKDWAKMSRASKLFVSLPDTNQIALIDTSSWKVTSLMPQVNHPTRLFLQPDEHFLWASIPEGLAVFKTSPFSFQYLIPTGKGEHDIAFSPDNRFAYVTNADDGTLAVVDLADFKVSKTLETGKRPVSVAYDTLSEAAYVTHAGSGTIACISGDNQELYRTITSEPGLGEIRFAPKGRWGFVVNPETNRLSLIDSSLDRIVQSGLVESAPSKINFTDNFAYIRHLDSANVFLVALDGAELGKEGTPIPIVDVPGGDAPYGRPALSTPANTIVQAPGANAVLIANPKDKAVYFYKEGMAAPMGQFNNYGSQPLAVEVVDRSLREKSRPGVYETVGKLEKAGVSDIAFFADTPRMTLGFEITVAEASGDQNESTGYTLRVDRVESKKALPVIARKPLELKFKVTTTAGSVPAQLQAYTFVTGGSWRDRQTVDVAADGTVVATITPPLPGVYQVSLKSNASGVDVQHSAPCIFEVVPKK